MRTLLLIFHLQKAKICGHRGEGVQKLSTFADVLYGCSLTNNGIVLDMGQRHCAFGREILSKGDVIMGLKNLVSRL